MALNFVTKLTRNNIVEVINNYQKSIMEMDINISADNIIDFIYKIKRDLIYKGPYSGVTLFEASNRIMSDLTMLYGIKDLLDGRYKEINFPEYNVNYGNGNYFDYDIMAYNQDKKLIGEVFNVSSSLFKSKKTKSLKKLRNAKINDTIKILIYNNDAVNKNYKPTLRKNEYHIIIDIKNNNVRGYGT